MAASAMLARRMLDVFPFIAWIAPAASLVLLAVMWRFGEMRRVALLLAIVWFLVAAYLQFLGASPMAVAIGLALQTMLAVYLMVRFRTTS